jgi:hypothetical protein
MAAPSSARLTPREGRRFALTLGAAFLVLGGISYWRGHVVPPLVLASLGVAFLAAGALVPGRLDPVYRAWMGLGHAMSKVTTPIVLSVLYFLVLTPTRFLLALTGRHLLRREPQDGSYWVRVPSGGRSNLHNQF